MTIAIMTTSRNGVRIVDCRMKSARVLMMINVGVGSMADCRRIARSPAPNIAILNAL